MALNKATGMATMPAPTDLEDVASAEQMAITKADAPHAEPGLQSDSCPLLTDALYLLASAASYVWLSHFPLTTVQHNCFTSIKAISSLF